MNIDTPPTAAAVRVESRLRPEQVDKNFANTAALETDIAGRITTYTEVIERKIAGVDDTPANQKIATEALQLRVLASLYGSAGQLNPGFWERSKQLKAESDDLVDDLLGVSPDETTNRTGTVTSTRNDGYSECDDVEYVTPWRRRCC